MPFARDTESRPAQNRVEPSFAIELSWMLLGCCEHKEFEDLPLPPGHETVHDRGRELWDDGHAVLAELLVMADGLGCLYGSSVEPLSLLDGIGVEQGADIGLRTEPEEERAISRRRLDHLRVDAEQRSRYAALVRDAELIARPAWIEHGEPVVNELVERFRAQLERGSSPLELVPPGHIARRPAFRPLVDEAIEAGRVVIAPTYFAGTHGHVLDLPGSFSIAIGTSDAREDRARRRATVERVAGQLKVLGDPTRLTILALLGHGPLTVGEIAREAMIAQPTASVHVRQLREAGLIDVRREGGRAICVVDAERVGTVLARAASDLFS